MHYISRHLKLYNHCVTFFSQYNRHTVQSQLSMLILKEPDVFYNVLCKPFLGVNLLACDCVAAVSCSGSVWVFVCFGQRVECHWERDGRWAAERRPSHGCVSSHHTQWAILMYLHRISARFYCSWFWLYFSYLGWSCYPLRAHWGTWNMKVLYDTPHDSPVCAPGTEL